MAVGSVPALAQQIRFAAQRGPYYVGDPVMLQVNISGVDSSVDVTCQLKGDPPEGLTIQGPQMGRSVRSFTQIINGKMSRHESIDYNFRFVVTASREADYIVGPFEVTANGQRQEIEGDLFRFGKLQNDPDMRIEVTVPQETAYVGQQVPVTIRWSFAGDTKALQHAFSNLQIRSPFFDQFPFNDDPPRTRTTLSLMMAKGGVEVDAEVSQVNVDGRDFAAVTGTRTMVPDRAGQFADIPVTCRTQKVTRWGRNFVGDPVPINRAPALAAGKPITLVVKPIPRVGRPDSFSGAVGKGFSIAVSANRSVVRVGDPIALSITIRGDGNVALVSLPPLSAERGFFPRPVSVSSRASHRNNR